ncbi:MAG: DUF2339 domain-containing protein [Gammaproteobacteria bacterium]|nr:DUF2339 domain-containing protein [Gammaproteobacteria bacterium]
MVWIYTLIGAVAGGALAEFTGFITGGIIGYLLAAVVQNKQQLIRLAQKYQNLDSQLSLLRRSLQKASVETPVKETPSIPIPSDKASETVVDDAVVSTDAPAEEKVVAAKVESDFSYKQYEPGANQSTTQNETWSKPSTTNEVNNIISKAETFIKRFFREGNLIVTIGVIILFIGASFLVKYSIDNQLVSIELRLTGLVIGSLAILLVGWRLREKMPGYALIMQGGAIAIIYLTIFASFKLYNLLPASIVFPLLIAFSALSMFLAAIQNSRALAVTAITGGFASPILASTGAGSHVLLFSYYLILNLAIFGISWFKSWRMLNVIGFAFTFIIGTFWGVTRYQSEHFASTEPFLITFFLIYVGISIIFAIKQKPQLKGYVDGTLVFGVPLVGFGLQGAMVHHIEYGLAWSAFALGFFYLALAKILWTNTNRNFRLLCEAMLALGVIYASLTIPLALDGRWTAASWAIEGVGFVWIGMRQARHLVKAFGLVLQIAGGALFSIDYPYSSDALMFLNSEYMGTLIVAISGFFTAYLFSSTDEENKYHAPLTTFYLIWALVWWYLGGFSQIERYLRADYDLAIYITFLTVSALIWLFINIRFPRNIFRFFPWLLLAPLWYIFIIATLDVHAFENYGYLAWPFALVATYGIYFVCDKKQIELVAIDKLHTAAYLLLSVLIGYECYWYLQYNHLAASWSVSVLALVLIAALQIINRLDIWPIKQYLHSYQNNSAILLVILLGCWSVVGNFMQYLIPHPIVYMPLLNPVDLIQALALFTVSEWYFKYQTSDRSIIKNQAFYKFVGGFCFIWFNVILLKTIHLITGVRYSPEPLFDTAVVQMAISISWTIIGLIIMVLASKKLKREIWFVGASLTGVVVVKLFILDQSDSGTIDRIVTFMIVGILLLVVGYFSPVPPTGEKIEKQENSNEAIDGKES